MKKIFLFIGFYVCCIFNVKAQLDSIKSGWGSLDFSIPESPALKILGNDPDNIIKPTSARAVAFSIGNYFLTGGANIPKSLAVEISPLLLNTKASLYDYNKNKFFYRARFSIGTSSAENGSYSVAEGFRFSIIDKSDLRTNEALNYYFMNHIAKDSKAVQRAISYYSIQHKLSPGEMFTKLNNDTAFQVTINKLALTFLSEDEIDSNSLSKFRDSIKNTLWNAPIWELGVAALQSSHDSLIKNLQFSQIGFWSTAGIPMGKKGQILIGAKVGMIDSIKWQSNISLGERAFYGVNNMKGFLQIQYDYKNSMNYFTTSFGCQFNIFDGIWGDFSVNLIVDGTGKLTYQPGFNIGLGTPEKK